MSVRKNSGQNSRVKRRLSGIMLGMVASVLGGCALIGPDFEKPAADLETSWLEWKDSRLSRKSSEFRDWWKLFKDPVLDQLIQTAYNQNLSLRAAGLRILEARAQLGVSVGDLYPQKQYFEGFVEDIGLPSRMIDRFQDGANINNPFLWSRIGLGASWEIDVWGKLRRAIESADAELMASIADYDSILVSLTADAANSYIQIRTLEKKLDIARTNVQAQLGNLKIAEAKFKGGSSSMRDVEQARTVLGGTQATIPVLEGQLRQTKNALCLLLGMAPNELGKPLGSGSRSAQIPVPPVQVAVGVPVDLLRRRPDIRKAEWMAASQSAKIGITKANLYPAFSISGSFAFTSSTASGMNLGDMFQWGSNFYRFGPAVQWNLFNYGQITNSVRAQDAKFQALLVDYQNTVLKAQKEVEDGLISFLKMHDSAEYLAQSTAAAQRSLNLATLQYREGIADFTTVLTAEQSLLQQQDKFAETLGEIASSLVDVYRSMGGGWQMREGRDFIPEPIKEAMAKRTDWGDLLKPMASPDELPKSLIRLPEW